MTQTSNGGGSGGVELHERVEEVEEQEDEQQREEGWDSSTEGVEFTKSKGIGWKECKEILDCAADSAS